MDKTNSMYLDSASFLQKKTWDLLDNELFRVYSDFPLDIEDLIMFATTGYDRIESNKSR